MKNNDFCPEDVCDALESLGYPRHPYNTTDVDKALRTISLYDAQKWFRETQGIYIAPRIYLYHDINLDDETSWECNIYIAYAAIYTIGKSLSYEDALLLGIRDGIKKLQELHERRRQKLEMENTEFDYGHNINHKEIN
jgi:hypothetical protein